MTTGRSDHTATLLASGEVLVVGGRDGNRHLASAELYDPALDTWTSAGSMDSARVFHTATLLASGKVLVTGGAPGWNETVHASAELYDPATRSWSLAESMATARMNHTATLLSSGQVLIAGGSDGWLLGTDFLASATLYDPVSDSWTPAGSMASARDRHTATMLSSGQVLVAGGEHNVDGTAEVYDPATDAWTSTGSMSSPRLGADAALLASGEVLVLGGWPYECGSPPCGPFGCGCYESLPVSSAEVYDPTSNSWASVGAMTVDRSSNATTLLSSGRVLACGRRSNTGPTQDASAELYDPASRSWSATGAMTIARMGHTATTLSSGDVLVVGGVNGSSALVSTEIYPRGSDAPTGTTR